MPSVSNAESTPDFSQLAPWGRRGGEGALFFCSTPPFSSHSGTTTTNHHQPPTTNHHSPESTTTVSLVLADCLFSEPQALVASSPLERPSTRGGVSRPLTGDEGKPEEQGHCLPHREQQAHDSFRHFYAPLVHQLIRRRALGRQDGPRPRWLRYMASRGCTPSPVE